MEINLDKYKSDVSNVLSGRERGEKVREVLGLEERDKKGESHNIIVPDDIDSINASFFLGLFGDSVRFWGGQEYRKKYIFKCDNIIQKNIEEGIARALKESNPLKY